MPEREDAPRYVEPLLGVVFDLDGTLVLSAHDFSRMRREVVRLAEHYGVLPGRLSAQQPVHAIMEAARAELAAQNVPEGSINRLEAEAHHAIDAIEMEALPRTTTRPGAEPLLRALTERGFRLGVLTRSAEGFCRGALDRTGLAGYFPYLRSRSSPGPAKPSPEALHLLLREMEVPADRALFVGDHPIDAECATRARVRFYGLLPATEEPPNGVTAERFRSLGAAAVARDLVELAGFLGVGAPTAADPR